MGNTFYVQSITLFNCQDRPAVFLDQPKHCTECEEHEQVLQKYTYEDIPLEVLNNPGWDPMCYISIQGFCYYMPAFIRLILNQTLESYYLDQFLSKINYQNKNNRLLHAFSADQKKFLVSFLKHVKEHAHTYAVDPSDEKRLLQAITLWEGSWL